METYEILLRSWHFIPIVENIIMQSTYQTIIKRTYADAHQKREKERGLYKEAI